MTFQAFKTANLARGKFQVGVSASSNTLILETGQGDLFPDVFPYALTYEQYDSASSLELKPVVKREIVKVTNKSGDTFTVERSFGYCPANDDATTQTNTAFAFNAGDSVFLSNISEIYDDIIDEVKTKLSISDYQNGLKTSASTSTGTDAYAITLDPAITAYLPNQTFRFQADVGNTGIATLNVNGLGAKTIKKQHDIDLGTGDIEAGQIVVVAYDGTNFQMDSQLASIPTIDINGETEDVTGDIDADFVHEFDVSAGANRKIKPNRWKASTAEILAGASNKFITASQLIYAGSAPTAGTDILVAQYLAELYQQGATPVKKFEGTILRTGTYTISMELKRQNGGSGGQTTARVYKNGVVFGTANTTGSLTYVSATIQNLAFTAGDVISLYLDGGQTSAYGYVQNFKVQCNQLHFTLA